MATYKSIDIRCEDCNTVWDDLVTKEEEEADSYKCEKCGGIGHRTLSKVNPTRKSYVDGTKRKGFADLKEAAKIEIDMYNRPVNDRAEHQKAIKELKKIR